MLFSYTTLFYILFSGLTFNEFFKKTHIENYDVITTEIVFCAICIGVVGFITHKKQILFQSIIFLIVLSIEIFGHTTNSSLVNIILSYVSVIFYCAIIYFLVSMYEQIVYDFRRVNDELIKLEQNTKKKEIEYNNFQASINKIRTKISEFQNFDFEFEKRLCSILKIASKALACNRISIWYFNENKTKLLPLFTLENMEQVANGTAVFTEAYPNYFEILFKDEIITANDALSDMRSREFINEYFIPHNIASAIDCLMNLKNDRHALLWFESQGGIHIWQENEIIFVKSMAEVLGNFISFKIKELE